VEGRRENLSMDEKKQMRTGRKKGSKVEERREEFVNGW